MRFPEPIVRQTPVPYEPIAWSFQRLEQLSIPGPLCAGLARRSLRTFAAPSLSALSALLWHAARCQETLPSPLGFDLQLRPTPSAGAIHPIHILLELPPNKAWARYDPVTHQLQVLSEPRALPSLRRMAEDYVRPNDGCLLAFVAEPGMTRAKYDHPESLIWRDAGVLQGVMAMTAPQTGLGLCLLGLTGDEAIGSLSDQGQLRGVGVAIVGAQP